jgi:hypothetical protein
MPYQEPVPPALVRIATAMFGKIRAPLKLRMPKKIVQKVVLPIFTDVDENIVVEVNEEEAPVVRNEDNALFTFGGSVFN